MAKGNPTKNVLDLTRAANRRQDDLRAAQERLAEERHRSIRREMKLRAKHAEQVAKSEAERTDALRELDRLELRTNTERQQLAVDTLDKATKAMADTLRAGAESMAKTLAAAQEAFRKEMDARVSAVEKYQAAGTGKGAGAMQLWAILGGAIILAITIYKALHG